MITGVRIMGVFYQNKYRQDKNVVWPEVPGAQRMSHSDIQAYLLRVLFWKIFILEVVMRF